MLALRYLINNLSKGALYSVQRNASASVRGRTYSAISVCMSSRGVKFHNVNQQFREKSSTSSPLAISAVSSDNDAVSISWADGSSTKFHNIWLRDHCKCKQCYNPATYQKELNILDVPLDIKPTNVSITDQNYLSIKWPDSHETGFDGAWLKQHSYYGERDAIKTSDQKKQLFLWDKKIIEANMPCPFDFPKVLSDEDELFALTHGIIKHGFAFVENTPTEVSAIEEISIKLGGFVMETHYGKAWEFSNEVLKHADTAYTSDYLRGHTDNTYFSHPAGLQMLHCVGHDGTGGLNLLVDGFFAAEKLRKYDKASFDFLTSTTVPFHYKSDSENIHLKAHGPVIELDPFNGGISEIRFNTYDTYTLDCLKYADVARFYKALKAFTGLTCAPENQLWFKLVPGLLLIMGNWRVLHGRSSFTGKRTMHGCYVNGDDFFGKYRAKAVAQNKN